MTGRAPALAASLLLLTSCTGIPPRREPEAGRDYYLAVRANASEQRFDLTLVSTANADLCLAPDNWPSAEGWMDHQGEPRVRATVAGRDYPLAENNMGYCPGCIAARLKAQGRVSASLPYARFEGLGTKPASAPDLRFSPSPYWCEA